MCYKILNVFTLEWQILAYIHSDKVLYRDEGTVSVLFSYQYHLYITFRTLYKIQLSFAFFGVSLPLICSFYRRSNTGENSTFLACLSLTIQMWRR